MNHKRDALKFDQLVVKRNACSSLLILVLSLVLVLIIWRCTDRNGTISRGVAGQIVEGMHRLQVVEIAGNPLKTDSEFWYYRVSDGLLPSIDLLHVGFDENDIVNWVSY